MLTANSTNCKCSRRGGTGRLPVIGVLLLMLFSLFSVSYAQFIIGQVRVASVTPAPESDQAPTGCVLQRVIGQTEYWYIQQNRRYTVRLEGVECNGEEIQVVLYDPFRDPNDPEECYQPICLTATRVDEGVYEFMVRFPPDNSQKGYYIRYCTTDCSPATGFVARRSDGVHAPAQLHLAYFDPSCEFLREDKDCLPPACVKANEDVELLCNPDPNDIPDQCDWKRDTYLNPDTCIVRVPECVPDPDTGLPYREIELPERGPCWRARVFTYRAIRCDGEECEVSRMFIWQEDHEPPVIHNVPDSPIDLGCLEEPPNLTCDAIIAQYNIFVTDNCDPSDGQYTQLECEASEVQQDGCRYSQTFTFWARDKCGNYTEQTLTFTWQIDPTPPVIKGVPDDQYVGCFADAHPTVECTGSVIRILSGGKVIYEFPISVFDDCDPNLQVECLVGELRSLGDCRYAQTVTVRATNKCGLTTEASVTFSWQYDPTPPVVNNVPENYKLPCNTRPNCDLVIALFNIEAKDNCDENPTLYCEAGPVEQIGSCEFRQTFTFWAVDDCGNRSADYVTVLLWKEDTVPPVLHNVPEGGDLGCNPTDLPECDPNVTATDNCTENVEVICTPSPIITIGCLRLQYFTYTAADECGNATSQMVLYWWIVDTTPPTVRCPDNITVQLQPGDCFTEVVYRAKAHDDCDPTVREAVCAPPSGTFFEMGEHTVTCSATDRCGNTGTCSFTVTVYGYICGVKFEDQNGNRTRDPGEPGLEGWTIILLASDGVTVLQTVQTGPDGSFCFFGLLPGTHYVAEESRDGWVRTTPPDTQYPREVRLPRDCGKLVLFGNRRTR